MANLVHRFLRNKSFLRTIPKLTTTTYPLTHQKPCISNVVESVSVEFDPVPLTNPVINVPGTKSLRFYPSYPIGYGFNPTLVKDDSGLIKTVSFVDTVVEEKDTVIYADSVKKKRKKKMNKHKYRKLRKRLGRKSK